MGVEVIVEFLVDTEGSVETFILANKVLVFVTGFVANEVAFVRTGTHFEAVSCHMLVRMVGVKQFSTKTWLRTFYFAFRVAYIFF